MDLSLVAVYGPVALEVATAILVLIWVCLTYTKRKGERMANTLADEIFEACMLAFEAGHAMGQNGTSLEKAKYLFQAEMWKDSPSDAPRKEVNDTPRHSKDSSLRLNTALEARKKGGL